MVGSATLATESRATALVLGYDDSPSARAALTTAIELALRFGDRLVIAFAYAPPQRLVGEEFAEHRRALAEIGERVTATALDRARSEGVEAEVALVPERAADALVSLATKHDARLIVVGTYGESPLKSAILGSTPHRLLHLSEIPVLVVPATA